MKKFLIILFAISAFNGHASVIIRNGLTQTHSLGASDSQEGKLLLINTGNKPERILVYFNDLETDCEGNVSYLEPGTKSLSLFPFLSSNTSEFIIEPNAEYELIYRINLSENTIKEGSLWTLMMVEVAEPISKDNPQEGFEIGSKIRYAVQIIANVGAPVNKQMEFKNIKLSRNQNQERVVETSLSNGGTFLILPKIEFQVFDESGNLVKEYKLRTKKIYPNNCQKFYILIDLPKGNYKAVLLADYLDEAIGVNIDISI